MPPVTDVAYMLRQDLEPAGIEVETDSGRIDFHALRGTCLSWLADNGVPLRALQEFARHSSPLLTMNAYARTLQASVTGVVARLPDLDKQRDAAKATGTDDVRPEVTPPRRTRSPAAVPPPVPPSGTHFHSSACAAVQQAGSAAASTLTCSSPRKRCGKLAHASAHQCTGVDGNRTYAKRRKPRF